MRDKITAERLVNAGQVLLGYYPRPTAIEIDEVIARLEKAFGLSFTCGSDAKALWRQRVGLPGATLIHISPLRVALQRATQSTSTDDCPPVADVVEQ